MELGDSYLNKGDLGKAEDTFRSCLEHNPNNYNCEKAFKLLEKRKN